MPSKITIPARTEERCEPCKYHKRMDAFYGKYGSWENWTCMHPKAYPNDSIKYDKKYTSLMKKIKENIKKEGRRIGKTPLLPIWCPLKRDNK